MLSRISRSNDRQPSPPWQTQHHDGICIPTDYQGKLLLSSIYCSSRRLSSLLNSPQSSFYRSGTTCSSLSFLGHSTPSFCPSGAAHQVQHRPATNVSSSTFSASNVSSFSVTAWRLANSCSCPFTLQWLITIFYGLEMQVQGQIRVVQHSGTFSSMS